VTSPALRSRHPTPWRALVVVVALLAGLLFVTSANTARGTDLRADRRLALSDLILREQRRVSAVERTARGLRARVEAATARAARADARVRAAKAQADALAGPAGLTAVAGPGIEVSLDDAPRDATPVGSAPAPTVDDLVVHEQDVHAVLNALWAGGAEAVTIMGRRVASTTAVRCVGNTLLLGGTVYSPPFVLRAIGSAVRLRHALDAAPGVRLFRSYVEAYHLGFDVRTAARLTMPAYDGTVPAGVAEVSG
jgi:uncharacterized protein YlxW (UPF0749 family)